MRIYLHKEEFSNGSYYEWIELKDLLITLSLILLPICVGTVLGMYTTGTGLFQ